MPMAGATRQVDETMVEDFSKHPFAGLPVTVRLSAEDATGQTGESAAVPAVLPMRSFYDPLALGARRAAPRPPVVGGERRAGDAGAARRSPIIRTRSSTAPRPISSCGPRRGGSTAADRDGKVAEVRDEVAEALWQAAVQIEDGNLGDAAQRLARAKERLEQALENGASDEEIARLMDELRQATRDYMQEMARNAIEKGQTSSRRRSRPARR